MKTLRMMTDEELVVLYAEGNNAAFDVLLNRYKSSIHSYLSGDFCQGDYDH